MDFTVKQDKAAAAFLELMMWLRRVLLQDSVYLKDEFPDHPIFQDPLFRTPNYTQWAAELKAGAEQL